MGVIENLYQGFKNLFPRSPTKLTKFRRMKKRKDKGKGHVRESREDGDRMGENYS